jgi:hypothetical protein
VAEAAQVNNNDPDSDLLRVDGTAALAGRLQATLLGGALAQGQAFDFVTAAVATGGFAAPAAGDLPPLPGALQWQIDVTAGGASLRVQ